MTHYAVDRRFRHIAPIWRISKYSDAILQECSVIIIFLINNINFSIHWCLCVLLNMEVIKEEAEKLKKLLVLACQSSNDDECNNLLLDCKVDPDVLNRTNLLHWAIRLRTDYSGYVIAKLLQMGADVDGIDSTTLTTPLQDAIIARNLETIRFLIKNGANVNFIDRYGSGHLNIAISMESEEIVKILLANGANVHLGALYPLTGIILRDFASEHLRMPLVKLLLDYGANADGRAGANELSPIHGAALKGQVEIVKLLLDRGAVYDDLLLLNAIEKQNTDIADLLLERGYDVVDASRFSTDTCQDVLEGNYKTIKSLFKKAAAANRGAWREKYPLHRAVGNGNERLVCALLAGGADINAQFLRVTAVRVAVECRQEQLYECLVGQLALLKAQNLHVSKENLDVLSAGENLVKLENDCTREIALLQSKVFDDSFVSYYDFLVTRDIDKLANLSSNESIVKVVKSDGFKLEYPIYGQMIAQLLDRGILRNDNFQLIKRFFNYLSINNQLPNLPFTSVYNLFMYLNDNDFSIIKQL